MHFPYKSMATPFSSQAQHQCVGCSLFSGAPAVARRWLSLLQLPSELVPIPDELNADPWRGATKTSPFSREHKYNAGNGPVPSD